MYIFKKAKLNKQIELFFFNYLLLRYGEKLANGEQEKYLDIFPSKTLRDTLFEEIINYLSGQNIDFDDIYIVRMNIGETVLLAGLIKDWIRINCSKKPILVVTQKCHKDIFDLYYPNIRYIYYPIEKMVLDNLLQSITYSYKNTRIFYYMPIKYGMLSKDGKHFSDYIKEVLNISEYNYEKNANLSIKLPNSLTSKNIDFNKLIIISPESNSCNPIKKVFWHKLITKLLRLNYPIFCNCLNNANYFPNTYNYKLSLLEIYALAQKSKAIIGMRSGLLDYLAPICNLNIYALYSKLNYWNIDSENVLKAYTLSKLPFKHSKNISEYNIENYSIDELIEDIINGLEARNGD